MSRILLWSALCILFSAVGCGGKKDEATPGGASPLLSQSKYDTGARAGEAPVAPALAERGKALFKTKGCTACHAWGQRLTCPDLKGVTQRRTAQWMEHQILHPEVMTKEDPIARGLMAQFALQMPNQGLTPDEARAVIEHLKSLDEEAKEAP